MKKGYLSLHGDSLSFNFPLGLIREKTEIFVFKLASGFSIAAFNLN